MIKIKKNGYYLARRKRLNNQGEYFTVILLLIFNKHGLASFYQTIEEDCWNDNEINEGVKDFKKITKIGFHFLNICAYSRKKNSIKMKYYTNVDFEMSAKKKSDDGSKYYSIVGVKDMKKKYFFLLKGKVYKDYLKLNFYQNYLDFELKDYNNKKILTGIKFKYIKMKSDEKHDKNNDLPY